jgi:hypothetical protein
VPKTDDKSRGPQVREASRLRATLGSEPSSGYAFHDHVRVERVRPGQREPVAQAASHAPRERAFAQTLVGGVTIQEVLANQQLAAQQLAAQALSSEATTLPPENDQGEVSTARVSWPPMPQVPRELEGSVVEALPSAPEPSSKAEIATGVHPVAAAALPAPGSAPPGAVAGGAIWEAMPSLVDAPDAVEARGSPHEQDLETTPRRDSADALRSAVKSGSPQPSGMSSKAAAYRPSAAELEAEHAYAYGDLRLPKYEKLVERNAWELLAEQLSAEADPSPALQLLRIVAQREMLKGDQKAEAARLAQEGISTIAKLLDLPEGSPTALVLGKRLLRRNPWTPKKQASAGLSIGLLLCGVTVGAAIGWLITALLF